VGQTELAGPRLALTTTGQEHDLDVVALLAAKIGELEDQIACVENESELLTKETISQKKPTQVILYPYGPQNGPL
jgi:hypothetical protein